MSSSPIYTDDYFFISLQYVLVTPLRRFESDDSSQIWSPRPSHSSSKHCSSRPHRGYPHLPHHNTMVGIGITQYSSLQHTTTKANGSNVAILSQTKSSSFLLSRFLSFHPRRDHICHYSHSTPSRRANIIAAIPQYSNKTAPQKRRFQKRINNKQKDDCRS